MRVTIFFILTAICIAVLFASLITMGAVSIPTDDIWATFIGDSVKDSYRYIILQSRLPFAITALLAGASLSVAGNIMQTTFRNPLAGPSLLGVSGGASLGVALFAMPVFGSVFEFLGTPIVGAIVGAAVIVILLSAFSSIFKSGLTLLIVGIMISYLCSAIISLLNFFAPASDVKQFAVWGMGSFSAVTLSSIPGYATPLVLLLAVSFLFVKSLDALLLGQRYAASMGYSIRLFRTMLLGLSSLLTAFVTAYCGPIGFIGLIVPHLAKIALRTSAHAIIIPASMLLGAGIAMLCALLTIIPSGWGILPINAVTPLIGVPVILYLLMRSRRFSF